jgi:protease IV
MNSRSFADCHEHQKRIYTMRRILLPGWLILVLSVSVSIAQTEADKSKAETSQAKTEQTEKDKAKDKKEKEADKSQSETESVEAKAIEAVEANLAKLKAALGAKGEKEASKSEEKKAGPQGDAQKSADKEKEKALEKEVEKAAQETAAKQAAAKKLKVVCFTLRGEYPEGPAGADLFSEVRPSLSDIIGRIDAAGKDKDVAAVWIKLEGLSAGRGKINELRGAIARLRKANKPVYGELVTAEAGEYLVASACDEVFMPESGTLIIPGVRAEMMFYKGFLDKIGVEFDALKMGKYKGAFEPFTRRDMSQPLRESLEALVDDFYNEITTTIAADRHTNDLMVKSLMDHGFFTAAGAKKAGLIDQVLYADEFEKRLQKKLGAESLDIITNYKTKNIEADFSGIGGLMKFMELLTGGKPSETADKKVKIAVVYAVGTIMEGKSSSSMLGESALGSTTLVAALRKASENPKVAAVVLRIDSPGGSATASDLIWRETVRMKKPLIASMGDVAGSGGYYIAMGANKIYAEPSTLTGSIGVLGGKVVVKGLFDKLGLDTEVISRGANSGTLSSTQSFTPAERHVMTGLLQDVYHQFVDKAAKGRKMSYEKLEELAQGRVYSGQMAKKLGLIDELGTLHDALAAAKTAAGLKPDAEVELLILPEPKTIFEQIFGDSDADAEADAMTILPKALDLLAQLKTIRQFFGEPALLWMPFRIDIK